MSKTSNKKIRNKFLDEYSRTLDIRLSAKNSGYKMKTGVAMAVNYLRQRKNQKALYKALDDKADMLQITCGYLVLNYLKILKWAAEEDETGKPRDPALMLRALEGLTKQIYREGNAKEAEEENETPPISGILNLNASKI